ncbi:MAG: galactokinase [Actinomycetales bacterium]
MSLAREFENLFGVKPDLITEAPGRVNLIGEHVDYNQGLVLPFAIDSTTKCAIRERNDEKILISSKQLGEPVFEIELSKLSPKSGPDWTRYFLGVIWSLGISRGVEILIDSDVPQGAGLSSSAALECSIALALNELFGLEISRVELAQLTQRAENDYVGVPCGIMDQTISLLGKSGNALLIDCRDLSTQQIPLNLESHGLQLLVVDTRAHHALVDGGYAKRRLQCEEVAKFFNLKSLRDLSIEQLKSQENELEPILYRRARHVVTEIGRVQSAIKLLQVEDFTSLGETLNQSHESLRDDYEVSCPELDCAVRVARATGALGARMVGGGFGGSAIALVKSGEAGSIANAIERSFSESSFKSPRFFSAIPSDGARLIDRSN